MQGLRPTVWSSFAENLDVPQKYNLIFIPAGSFGLITDPVAIKKALQLFYDHLTQDGVLLFEGETLQFMPPAGIWRGTNCMRPDGKMIMLSNCAALEGNVCTSIGKYELIDQNSIIHTEIETYKIRLYVPEELLALLDEVGFSNIRLVKAFDRNSIPGANDEVIVYECHK